MELSDHQKDVDAQGLEAHPQVPRFILLEALGIKKISWDAPRVCIPCFIPVLACSRYGACTGQDCTG